MARVSIIVLAAFTVLPLVAMGADNNSVPSQVEVSNTQSSAVASVPAAAQTDAGKSSDVASSASPAAAETAADSAADASLKTVVAEPVAVVRTEADSASAATVAPSKNNQIITSKINNLQDEINQIQQQTDQYRQQTQQLQYSVFGLAALVVLLALLSMTRRRKEVVKNKSSVPARDSEKTFKIEDDTSGEYDFMGSSEGIPAKLDLARAYIAMEDFTAARETLAEILGEGGEQHREEARSLLNKINQ
jgi:FimV-like protein